MSPTGSILSTGSQPPPYSTNPPNLSLLSPQQGNPHPQQPSPAQQQPQPQQQQVIPHPQPYAQPSYQYLSFPQSYTMRPQPYYPTPPQIPQLPIYHFPYTVATPPTTPVFWQAYPAFSLSPYPTPPPTPPPQLQLQYLPQNQPLQTPQNMQLIPYPPALISGTPDIHPYPLIVSKEAEPVFVDVDEDGDGGLGWRLVKRGVGWK